MTPCGALRASPHHQQRNDSTHLSLIIFFHCFFHCFLRFRCGDAFCTDTLLQTDDEQKPLHRAAFMRRYSYTERFARRLTFTRRRLYTQRLSRNEMFTQQFLHTDVLHRDVFAHINKGTQALLHTEPFIERNLCTEQLLHKKNYTGKFWPRKNCPHRLHKKKYTPKLSHADILPRAAFTHIFFPHRSLYAQKSFCTAVFTQTLLHTDAFTQKHFYTQKIVHTARYFTHNQFLHGDALLPLHDHLPFVFPLSSIIIYIYYIMHECL